LDVEGGPFFFLEGACTGKHVAVGSDLAYRHVAGTITEAISDLTDSVRVMLIRLAAQYKPPSDVLRGDQSRYLSLIFRTDVYHVPFLYRLCSGPRGLSEHMTSISPILTASR
jgi:hypothetical protein